MVVIRKIMNDVTACRWMLLLTADTCVVPEPMMKCANQNAMVLRSVERSSSWYILPPAIHRPDPICIHTDPSRD